MKNLFKRAWFSLRCSGILPFIPLLFVCGAWIINGASRNITSMAFGSFMVYVFFIIKQWVDYGGIPLFSRMSKGIKTFHSLFSGEDGEFSGNSKTSEWRLDHNGSTILIESYRTANTSFDNMIIKKFTKDGFDTRNVELTTKDKYFLRRFMVDMAGQTTKNINGRIHDVNIKFFGDLRESIDLEHEEKLREQIDRISSELAEMKIKREKGLTESIPDSKVSDMKQIPNLKVCQ